MYTTRQPKKLPKRKILMLLKFVDACSQKEKTVNRAAWLSKKNNNKYSSTGCK